MRNIKTLFFLLMLAGLPFWGYTQVNPDPSNYTQVITILPPSPNAASLGKYGGINLNLSQGALNLSVPLYNYASTNIKLPLSLSYNSNSIKVDEIGSDVGMSWALNAGGLIARTVYGMPDDVSNRATPPSNIFGQNDSVLSFLDNITINSNGSAFEDGQPDLFSFNFNGYTGKFILDSSLSNPILLTYSGLKIESNLAIENTGAIPWHFRITTPDGVKYYFGGDTAVERSTSIQVGTEMGRPFPVAVPTAYYLTKIVHPDGDSVWFTYVNYSSNYKYSINESMIATTPAQSTISCNQASPPNPVPSNPTSYTLINTTGVLLQQINSCGGGQISFNYTGRLDHNGVLLSKMSVYPPGRLSPLQTYIFNYQYSVATDFTNAYTDSTCLLRPFLLSVTENSGDSSIHLPYQFQYTNINSLPPRLSYAQDHYGFFNGKPNQTLVPLPQTTAYQYALPAALANRNIDTNYCMTGLLTSITYPTGGKDSIDYEPNYTYGAYDIPPPDTVISLQANGGFRDGPVVSYTLYPLTTQSMIMYGSCTYSGNNEDPLHDVGYATMTDITDPSNPAVIFSQTVPVGSNWSLVESMDAGKIYTVSVQASGDSVSSFFHFIYQNGAYQTALMNQPTGGNRVKRVTSMDPVANVSQIKRYYYGPLTSLNASTAVNMYNPLYQKLARFFVSCAVDGLPDWTFNEYDYFSEYATTQCNLYEYGGSPVSYSAVTESFGENFENGGIEHDFTQEADIDGDPIIGDFLLSAPRTSYSWLNGRETFTYTFKGSGETAVPVKKTYTKYAQDGRENNTYNAYMTSRNYVAQATFEPPTQYEFSAYNLTLYSYLQRWMYVDTVININYDVTGSNTLTDTLVTVYGNPFHALPTQVATTESNYIPKIVSYFYPSDTVLTGNAETARQALLSTGIIDPPLITVEQRGSDTMFVERTDYNVFGNELVLPQLHNLKVGNHPIEPRLQLYGYNGSGRLLEQSKIADLHTSYLWDYNSMYAVAAVTGAGQSDIAYTSFEADGTGNWTIGAGSVDSTTAITGNKSYILNSGASISASALNSSSTYIVSYWTMNHSAFAIAGTISGYPVQGKTEMINGKCWILYVHKVTGQSTITLTGSGGHIDELRLYPSTAQMTTYTYSPLVGMTSQTDVGNRVTYYEYDGLARLKRIRDQDYNILKTYEYQYQMPAGCNGCQTLAMETFLGTNTIGYPVGVFDIHSNLVGNAAGASAYVSLWNSDTADARIGTLSTGNDSLHFNIVLNAGQTLPASVTGCRYYQYDLPGTQLDAVRNLNGTYVDFGDGTGMHLAAQLQDTPQVIAPNTTYTTLTYPDYYRQVGVSEVYLIHNYRDSSTWTITFYHNDANESSDLDNAFNPATSLMNVRNLRGNLPQNTDQVGGSSYQQPSALTVSGISNWNNVTGVRAFNLNVGDRVNGVNHINYAQDFMQNNKGLDSITTQGCSDTTFKLSLLKSNWNTWFTNLFDVEINDNQWNREDISALTNLWFFRFYSTSTNGLGANGIPEIDNIINQIAAGAGKYRNGGVINISWAGFDRTSASQASYQFLKPKGWTIFINGVNE